MSKKTKAVIGVALLVIIGLVWFAWPIIDMLWFIYVRGGLGH